MTCRHGTSPQKMPEARTQMRWTDRDRSRLIALYQAGIGIASIRNDLHGYSTQQIWNQLDWLIRQGVLTGRGRGHAHNLSGDLTAQIMRMHERGETADKIAKALKLPKYIVANRINAQAREAGRSRGDIERGKRFLITPCADQKFAEFMAARNYASDDADPGDTLGRSTMCGRAEPGFRSSCAAQCMGVGR